MMSISLFRFAAIATFVSSAFAHMEVTDPTPLRSKYNSQYTNNVDYDMTTPLSSDGSNFPCKGYQSDVPGISTAVATLKAGTNTTLIMGGGAPHEGGSCQFSISYDNAKTFGVLYNQVGGCMLAPSYTFTVPSNLPSASNVLLSWTWFNKVGNREMYQNCIAVNVEGSGSDPISLSKMFVANIGNGCTTIESTEIDFANPSAGLQPGCTPITPDQMVTVGPNGSSDGNNGAPADTPAPQPTPTGAPAPPPVTSDTPSSSDDYTDDPPQTPTPTGPASGPTSTPSKPTTTKGTCTPGTYLCSDDGLTWSMCANGVYVFMGYVAPGTKCVEGQHIALNGATRSRSGLLRHVMRRRR